MNDVGQPAPGEPLPPVATDSQYKKKGLALGDYAERFALVGAWIVVIIVFSNPGAEHVLQYSQLHHDVRYPDDPGHAGSGSAHPADGR